MIRFLFFCVLLLCLSSASFAQQNNDSLWSVYSSKTESIVHKLTALDDLSWNFLSSDPDSSYFFSQLELKLAKTLTSEKQNAKWQAKALNKIGIVYEIKSDYPNALDYQFKSLKLKEKVGDKKEVAISLIYIGNNYYAVSDFKKALKYYVLSLKIFEKLKDEQGVAGSCLNIASVYLDQKNFSKALDYQLRSTRIFEKINDRSGLAYAYGNIGHIYECLSEDTKALEYQFKSLKLNEELGEKKGLAFAYGNIGIVYLKQKKYDIALKNSLIAIKLCEEIGDLDTELSFQETVYKIYKATNESKKALEHYERLIMLKDSVFKNANQKEIFLNDMNYEFEKKQAVASAKQDKKDALVEKEKQKQSIILFTVISGLVLVIVVSLFIYNRFRITQRQKSIIEKQKQLVDEKNDELNQQNEEIEHQKQVIEEHQKEIIDSITYAKQIQDAILPPQELIKEKLPDSFVLFKPKDIVAGDFYWMEEIKDTLLIAAADCTGHGVPGAMVSVVCSNALNRAVKEFHLIETGKILDKVTDLVIETFEKSTSDVKDGMDISILAINKTTKQIQWSGANNPLWYFENGMFHEIIPDKQPIGKMDNRQSFTTHTIEYTPNSTYYLFTDGFADQFGGPKGKKFKYRQFQEVLSTLVEKAPIAQKMELDTVFEDWRGQLEQVDDVCVIGVRL